MAEDGDAITGRQGIGEVAIVLDDDAQSASLIVELAAGLGYEARAHPSATRVNLAEIRRAPYLVLDLSMPGMDGIDFLALLGAVHIDTPLVLTSGMPRHTLEAAGAAARASGLRVAGLLRKPFSVRDFHRVVGEALTLARARIDDRARPDADIVAAFDAGALRAHFQPKVNLADGRLVGFESLARLELGDGTLLAPGEFLTQLDAAGRLGDLSDRMLEHALRAHRRWANGALHVSVNLPARHLEHTSYPERVRACLERTGTPPEALCLEITESEFISADSVAFESLVRLALMGVRLSMDDFGTGFSSFEQLNTLPCDELKIDRSFIAALSHEEYAETVVRKTVELTQELGLTVTAEGIENPLQAEILMLMGCQVGQGYLFGRPVPEAEASVAPRTP